MKNYIINLLKKHRLIFENLTYLSFLQVFLLIYPLITYPYLVKVLGRDLYGVVLTAQMLASYASLFVDFGSNLVCAKHVSINRNNPEKLSEVLSNVLAIRFVIFILFFIIYVAICAIVPIYKTNIWIFLLTYGFVTNELFFPQFFFQGLEKMKVITIINVVTKLLLVILIFVLVKSKEDVLLVPLIYSFGFFIGGIISLYQIIHVMKIKIVKPTWRASKIYIKDSSAIFATNLIMTIKDKINYFLVGSFVGMSEVVVYDLGIRLNNMIQKPYTILCQVLFPRFARNRSTKQLGKTFLISFCITLIPVIIANLFLDEIALFFLHEHVALLPLRLLLMAPLILSISYVIANIMFVAYGYNRYAFYSIVVTTIAYIFSLMFFWLSNNLSSILSFVYVAMISYMAELVYRLIKAHKVYIMEMNKE